MLEKERLAELASANLDPLSFDAAPDRADADGIPPAPLARLIEI